MIPFKYNKQEIPLLNRVKELQDAINTMISDFENNMQEDARNTILILKNYDGQDLGEFRRNLAAYGAVKVRVENHRDFFLFKVPNALVRHILIDKPQQFFKGGLEFRFHPVCVKVNVRIHGLDVHLVGVIPHPIILCVI